MGYSSGASRFGYVSHMGYSSGASHLGYAPGASTLGDFSPSMENAAVDAGISTSDIDLLNNLGATDQDLENIINGNQSLTQVYAKYGVTIPAASTATANTTPASIPTPSIPAAPAAQVPGGSTLLYSANWTAGIGNLNLSPNTVISSLGAALAPHGMSVVNGQASSSGPINYGIQVTVLDTIGNSLLTDAKSVLDALMHQIVGNNLSGTSLSLVSAPGQSASPGVSLATDPIAWLENNALLIALGVGGLIVLNNFTRGKRR